MKATHIIAVRQFIRLTMFPLIVISGSLGANTLDTPEAGSTYDTTDALDFNGTVGPFRSPTLDFGTWTVDNGVYTYHWEKRMLNLPIVGGNGKFHAIMVAPPLGWSPGDANHYARVQDAVDAAAINYFITVNP